ncbi:MAG TPA: DUF2281 domain-containing protein [Thermomicrobiales bacterium]|nr:DUF2281 domain-containing protein [Thermomicrobiales bacterium]
MIRTSIDAAKLQLEEIIEAALRGEDVFVTTKDDDGEHVLQLTVTRIEPGVTKRRRAGTAKGLIWMSDDFDEPLEELEEYMR